MNVEELKGSDMIIYDVIAGSHAYNLNVSTSDKDVRGVFMLPQEAYLELTDPPKQIGDKKHDITYYSLKRFFELIKTSNPNLIELLWMPNDCINFCSEMMRGVINQRSLFISKKAYFTHSSYAYSQIKKASGQNKMVNNPHMAIKPEKEDFCWFIPKDAFNPCEFAEGHLPPARPIPAKEYFSEGELEKYHASSLEHSHNIYRIYNYQEESKGIFRGDDMLVCESIPLDDEYSHFEGLLIYNKDLYEKSVKDYKRYNEWMKNRNEKRWIDQETGIVQYDCKNMMHCMRLLISGENILKKGFPIVRFEGLEREYLMSIRNGELDYDDIMSEVDKRMSKLEDLYKTSDAIPHSVNIKKINELYMELRG